MDSRTYYILRASIAISCIIVLASSFFITCDAKNYGRAYYEGQSIRSSRKTSPIKSLKKLKPLNRLNKYSSLGYSNFDSYGSPSSLPLPPFNSLAPQPSIGTPSSLPAYSPPVPNPPHKAFGPPSPNNINNSPPPPPPYYGSSSQPKHSPNPPPKSNVPVPNPSPPQVYLPPIVYPPPPSSNSPSSPHHKKPPSPQYAVWCVAKPTVPDPIIQLAMDYACGSGADCKSIQPNGSCYFPNTMLAHASYAFNSYWQNTRIGGGTCDFGGTAMLVTVDPSYGKCKFVLT